MNLNQKNTKKQGDVGLGIAIGYFASEGYTVCIPLTDSQDYDLVVEMENKFMRIQVKTTRGKSKGKAGYCVQIKTGGGREGKYVKKFDPTKSDFVFVLTEQGDQYLIPSLKINGNSVVTVGNRMYKEYIVARVGKVDKSASLFE